MSFGGWSINEVCFKYIREILPSGKTILEFGSGFGTEQLSKHYTMYSIENYEEWVGKYKSTYIHAPIRNYEIGGSELFGDEEFFTAPDIPEQKGWYDPDIVKKNLSKLNLGSFNKGIVGINIGKNKNSSNAIDDYCYCLEKLGSSAHYVTINISSPNTPGLRNLQNRGQIENLVKSLHRIREKNSDLTNKSLLLKISPDLDDEQLRDIALMSLALNVDGLIISNSTIKRYANLTSKNQNEVGGLSGKPLFIDSTLLLKKMYNLTNGQIPLIGVGGISNGIECYNKIKAGASLVQLYTALVYNSPILIKYMKNEMLSCLNIDGFKNIKEVIGKDS